MSIKASSIIDRAEIILQDTTNVRWPTSELRQWLTDAQREVIIYRPEACSKNLLLVTNGINSKQALGSMKMWNTTTNTAVTLDVVPTGLVDLIRNYGSGTTPASVAPGRAIRMVAREIMDAQNPSWHTDGGAQGSTEVKHFIYDLRDPLHVYVWPKPAANTRLEAVIRYIPRDVVSDTQLLDVADIFGNVLLDYVLYRAYSKDSEYAGNAARATAHYTAFANALGIKGNSDVQFGPATNSPLNPNHN